MRVVQLIDSLHAGGAERVALNLANELTSHIDLSCLCITREEGILKEDISTEVKYLFLNKKGTLDISAMKRFYRFIKTERIDIIHAHSTSFFLAALMRLAMPRLKIVWHDHYGKSEFLNQRPLRILRMMSSKFSWIISVNTILKDWAIDKLRCPNVTYIANFVNFSKRSTGQTQLNGLDGKRMICLANLREQKDHKSLIMAFEEVVNKHPDWTLHLVGKDFKNEHSKALKTRVNDNNLRDHVYFYGSISDVSYVLSQCEIGVLSSVSEGLPLSILEYGLANLCVISTAVGEIPKIIDDYNDAILVEAGNALALQKATEFCIENEDARRLMADNFTWKVKTNYSSQAILQQHLNIYNTLLGNE